MKPSLWNIHQGIGIPYLWNKNLIQYFIEYFEHRTYDNDPIGDDWTNITNDKFNDFCMEDYYNFISLQEAGLLNPRPNSTTSSYKLQYSVDNLNIHIKINPTTYGFYMVTPFCNYTNKSI